jgi:hypothetical protein
MKGEITRRDFWRLRRWLRVRRCWMEYRRRRCWHKERRRETDWAGKVARASTRLEREYLGGIAVGHKIWDKAYERTADADYSSKIEVVGWLLQNDMGDVGACDTSAQ